MSENTHKWAKQVSTAADKAVKTYEQEVSRLEKRVAEADKREGKEAAHVARQVDRDMKFAEHHIEHLQKVVANEDARVESAYARLAKRADSGASDEALKRDAAHVAKVEASAEKRIELALERATADIERDAKAAARHVVVGLEKIDEYEEDLGDEANAAAERVTKALSSLGKKVNA